MSGTLGMFDSAKNGNQHAKRLINHSSSIYQPLLFLSQQFIVPMSTLQVNLTKFRIAKKYFLEKARNATVTNGLVDGIEEMDSELVSDVNVYSTG